MIGCVTTIDPVVAETKCLSCKVWGHTLVALCWEPWICQRISWAVKVVKTVIRSRVVSRVVRLSRRARVSLCEASLKNHTTFPTCFKTFLHCQDFVNTRGNVLWTSFLFFTIIQRLTFRTFDTVLQEGHSAFCRWLVCVVRVCKHKHTRLLQCTVQRNHLGQLFLVIVSKERSSVALFTCKTAELRCACACADTAL